MDSASKKEKCLNEWKRENSVAAFVCMLGPYKTHLSCENGMSLNLYFHLIKKSIFIIIINANSASNIEIIEKVVRFPFTNVHPPAAVPEH